MSRALSIGLMVFAGVLAGEVVDAALSRAPTAGPTIVQPVSVVDIAHGVSATELSNLVRLLPDERVIAVADRPVANDLAAGAAIAELRPAAGKFLDLTVGGAHGKRRVLVLMH